MNITIIVTNLFAILGLCSFIYFSLHLVTSTLSSPKKKCNQNDSLSITTDFMVSEEYSIKDLMRQSYLLAKEKGQWDVYFNCTTDEQRATVIAATLSGVHSEITEAYEALRDGKFALWYGEDGKPEGFVTELGDTVIRICNICQLLELDLVEAIRAKMEYSKQRPHMHGRKYQG